jgi:hypothetical protein
VPEFGHVRFLSPVFADKSIGAIGCLASSQAIRGVVCGFVCGLRQVEQGGLLVPRLPRSSMYAGGRWSDRVSVGSVGVCADAPVEGAALVAVPVEAADEVATVLMTECDCHVLG